MDTELLWLWCRPAAAALIQPLAWELSRVRYVALKCKKEKRKKKKERKKGKHNTMNLDEEAEKSILPSD